MIKLIVTDVDDTILEESHTDLNPEYFDVIREFRKKGVIFVVASGRQKPSVKKTFIPVNDEIMYLADNGTDIETPDFISSIPFADGDYEKLAKDLKKLGNGYEIMACKPNISYIEESAEEYYNRMTQNYGYSAQKVSDIINLDGICKVSLYNKNGIDSEVERSMHELWDDRMDVCIAGLWYLDFMGKGCNKGKGLSVIQDHYGIKPEETVAFGNADNDIPMLLQAKYSYAVENASDNLKKVASEVIGPMKEDAVLKKMKEILRQL